MALNRVKIVLLKIIALTMLIFWVQNTVFALDYPIDFTTPSSYTSSNSSEAYVNNSLARLKEQLSHFGNITTGGSTLLNNPYDVIAEGNYAYITSSTSNAVEIVNISNPASPTHVSSIWDNGGTLRLSEPMGIVKNGRPAIFNPWIIRST